MRIRFPAIAVSTSQETPVWRLWVFVVLLLTVVTVSPWFTALFFPPASTVVSTVITLLCMMAIRYRRLPVSAANPVVWALVLAAYMALTNLWAASALLSIQVTAMQVSAILFFVAVSQWGMRVGRLYTVAASIVGIALYIYGMGAEVGWWKAVDAVYGKHLLASVFEYHNTFGAIELAIAVFAVLARPTNKPHWGGNALAWVTFIIGLDAVLGSYSRVAWAFTPFALIAAFWIKARLEKSLWPVGVGVMSLIVSAASGVYAIKVLETASSKDFVLSALMAICGSAVLTVVETKYSGIIVSKNKLRITAGLFVVLIAAGLYILRHHLAHSAASITARLHSISLSSVSLQERFYYYRNALAIWKSSPVFGSGGATWTAKYQAFQTLPYVSEQVHSSVLDQLLNGGVIGLALELTVFALALATVVRGAQRLVNKEQRALLLASFMAAAVMLAHSCVDFDFAFGFYQYMFWGFLGLAMSMAFVALTLPETISKTPVSSATSGTEWKKMRDDNALRIARDKRLTQLKRSTIAVAAAVGGVTLALSGTLAAAQILTGDSTQPGQTIDSQLNLTQMASTLAPYSPDPYLSLAQYDMETAQSAQDPSLYRQAWNNVSAAAAVGPWDPTVQTRAAILAYNLGNGSAAVKFAQRAYRDAPFSSLGFRTLLGLTMWNGAATLKTNPQAGRAELQRVQYLYRLFVQQSKIVNLALFPTAIPLRNDAPIQVYRGASDYLLGHYRQSLAVMNPFLKLDRDQAAVNIYEIVTVLDDAKLHIATKASVFFKKQILANASVAAEYTYLLHA